MLYEVITAGLQGFTGDVYAHTGVITNLSIDSHDWKYVMAPWATNYNDIKLISVITSYSIHYTKLYELKQDHNKISTVTTTQIATIILCDGSSIFLSW